MTICQIHTPHLRKDWGTHANSVDISATYNILNQKILHIDYVVLHIAPLMSSLVGIRKIPH